MRVQYMGYGGLTWMQHEKGGLIEFWVEREGAKGVKKMTYHGVTHVIDGFESPQERHDRYLDELLVRLGTEDKE